MKTRGVEEIKSNLHTRIGWQQTRLQKPKWYQILTSVADALLQIQLLQDLKDVIETIFSTSTCLKKIYMVLMFIYISIKQSTNIRRRKANYVNTTKKLEWVNDLFEELCAQIMDLRNCHQYQRQQHPSIAFL